MKLHLPLPLRHSLLAVLSFATITYSGETIVVENGTEEQPTILHGESYEDATIIINKDGILQIDYVTFTGETYITVNDGGTLTNNGSYIALVGSNYENIISGSGAKIIVERGGIINDSGYTAKASNGSAQADITVNGTYNLNGGCIAYTIDDHTYELPANDSDTHVDIAINDGGVFNMNWGGIAISGQWNEYDGNAGASIVVDKGGVFKAQNGHIAYAYYGGTANVSIDVKGDFSMIDGGSGDNYIAYAWEENSHANADIVVREGGKVIGYSFTMAHTISMGKAKTNITVEEGGICDIGWISYAIDEGSRSEAHIEVSGEFGADSIAYASHNASAISDIKILNGGVVSCEHVAEAFRGGLANATISVDKGGSYSSKKWGTIASVSSGGKANAEITINGEFNMCGSSIAEVIDYGSASATIIINDGGRLNGECFFAYTYSDRSYADATTEVNITVNRGGYAYIGNELAYTSNKGSSNATVHVNEGGTVLLQGEIAYSPENSEGGTANVDIIVEGTLNLDANYIAAGAGSSARISVLGNGLLNYQSGMMGEGLSVLISEHGVIDMTDTEFAHDIMMCGGSLRNASLFTGKALVNVDDEFSGTIDFGGADAKQVDIQKAGRGVNFRGLMEGSELTLKNDIALRVGAEHITLGNVHRAQNYMIEFNGESGTINIKDATVTLEFDAEELFKQHKNNDDVRLAIRFTNGSINGSPVNFVFGGGWDMWIEEDSVDSINMGKLVIRGNLEDVWFAADHVGSNGEVRVSGFMPWEDYDKVVVNKDTHLKLNKDEQLNYLEGSGNLKISGKGDVTLHNKTANTVYAGNVTIDSGVLIKSGMGSFTMSGCLIADNVKVIEGDFIIASADTSTIGGLEGKAIVNGSLDLKRGSYLAEIVNQGYVSITGSSGETIILKNIDVRSEARLHLSAGSSSIFSKGGADVQVVENAVFRKNSITVLTLNLNSIEIPHFSEATMLNVDNGIWIERGAKFVLNVLHDAMPESRDNLSNILIMNGRTVRIVDVCTDDMTEFAYIIPASDGESLDVTLGGLMHLYYTDASLTVQDDAIYLNATLKEEYVNNDENNEGNSGQGDGEQGEGNSGQGGGQGGSQGGNGGGQGGSGGQGNHAPKLGFFELAAVDGGSSSAAQAGGGMLDSVNLLTTDATLIGLGNALVDMINDGQKAQAAKVMAAVAGGAVTALGSAQRDALRERMGRAREHAAQHYFAPQDKKLHTWIEAAASYAKVGADGDECGYKLDSWGGSVGADYAVSKDLSVGLSLTAMYGDLTAEAAEQAEGKLDAYYVTLWAHKQSERWGHSFIVMASTSDATLDRTVSYGTGAYTAQGSTSGSGYGAMYELTYDVPLSETSLWQPLASISMMSTTMDSYDETGAEGAGLAVGEQKQTVTTVAIGARWVSKAGADLFGSTAVVELSARVAQDMGDTRSEADNALLANPGYTRKVQGAEVGSTAVQIGAGLAIPTGQMSQIYVNAHTDLRSGATSWNVSAGVRLSF